MLPIGRIYDGRVSLGFLVRWWIYHGRVALGFLLRWWIDGCGFLLARSEKYDTGQNAD